MNPETALEARYRIAVILDTLLGKKRAAQPWYEEAARCEEDAEKRADAAKAAAEAAAEVEANKEKTPTEKYIEEKAERLKPKSIGK